MANNGAYVADAHMIWHSEDERDEVESRDPNIDPKLDRVELEPGDTVPDNVPKEVVEAWEQSGSVHFDKNRERIATQGGPPKMLNPIAAPKNLPPQAKVQDPNAKLRPIAKQPVAKEKVVN
jgi:hypothetical protein